MEHSLDHLIRQRSRQLGLTQTEIAARAGFTRAYLHRLGTGGVPNPGIRTLQKLAAALQLPANAVYRVFSAPEQARFRESIQYLGLPVELGGAGPEDALIFVADVTVPDHSLMLPGERFNKTWAVQNAGTVPWLHRQLVRADEELVVARRDAHGQLHAVLESHLDSLGRVVAVPPTMPGQVVELSVEFAAPTENCSVASVWRMEDELGRPCFDDRFFLQVIVTVVGG